MKRRQKMALAFGMLLSSIGLGIAEFWARVQEGDRIRIGSWSYEPDTGKEVTTRLQVVFDPPELKYVLRSRKLGQPLERGWPEEQAPPVKQPGEPVVACVGDSLTYGVGVGPAEAWPAVVSAQLPKKVKVYNFGVPGYDVEQVATVVTTRIETWKPDLVVWGTYTNDVMPTYLQYGLSSRLPIFVGAHIPASAQVLPEPIALPLVHHSALFRAFQGAVFARRVDPAEAAEPQPGWYERHLDEIVNWSQVHSVPLIVLAIPPHILADSTLCKPGQKYEGFCDANLQIYRRLTKDLEERHLNWIDGLAAYRSGGVVNFFPADPNDVDHPNAAGQKLLGDAVLPAVRTALGL